MKLIQVKFPIGFKIINYAAQGTTHVYLDQPRLVAIHSGKEPHEVLRAGNKLNLSEFPVFELARQSYALLNGGVYITLQHERRLLKGH